MIRQRLFHARVTADNSVAYADDKVTFNGKAMSVAEFMAFATGGGMGMSGLGDDSEQEQYGLE